MWQGYILIQYTVSFTIYSLIFIASSKIQASRVHFRPQGDHSSFVHLEQLSHHTLFNLVIHYFVYSFNKYVKLIFLKLAVSPGETSKILFYWILYMTPALL